MSNQLQTARLKEPQILSLHVLADMGAPARAEQSQRVILVRHFLDRFFNNEMASSDDDGKTRLIQVACATGLPGLVAAMYLWPVYHDIFRLHRPYWAQVGDHYFFVVYSMVVMGMIVVFEWDLFFPDLLDIFVLSSLPIKSRTLFLARIVTVCIFIVGFLLNANILSTFALPAAIDPPSASRFLAAHILAVAGSGVFAAATILAIQGALLTVLGERAFRKISLTLQATFITALLMVLFLIPVLSGALPGFMHSSHPYAFCFPPFWFLGVYQRILEGPSALPIYTRLAQIGCKVTLAMTAAAIIFYPLAYWRRTREIIEGSTVRDTRTTLAAPFNRILHETLVRIPARRAIFHFISQTLFRVQRYRIYLAMYAGFCLSLVAATLLRLQIEPGRVTLKISPGGMRTVIPMAAFLIIAGLRVAFVSPGNPRGRWIFRVVKGRPEWEQLTAAKTWILTWAIAIMTTLVCIFLIASDTEIYEWRTIAGQILMAIGSCVLLTDAFFLSVKIIPFTGERVAEKTNLAIVLLKYVAAFVPWVVAVENTEPWIEASAGHMVTAIVVIGAAHMAMQAIHQKLLSDHLSVPDLDEDQHGLFQTLGLRY
ncbi:MAG TPA: hypothetical protein VMF56_00675 [Acidobacteriaceae bacterium]|nr:hypothetical protein [Acidobacteriaceae bacterium]